MLPDSPLSLQDLNSAPGVERRPCTVHVKRVNSRWLCQAHTHVGGPWGERQDLWGAEARDRTKWLFDDISRLQSSAVKRSKSLSQSTWRRGRAGIRLGERPRWGKGGSVLSFIVAGAVCLSFLLAQNGEGSLASSRR